MWTGGWPAILQCLDTKVLVLMFISVEDFSSDERYIGEHSSFTDHWQDHKNKEKKSEKKKDWQGFRIIMRLINKVCYTQSSVSLIHTSTHFSNLAFQDISRWHICLWNSGWHVCHWPVAISNTTTISGIDKKKGTDLAGANTFAKDGLRWTV